MIVESNPEPLRQLQQTFISRLQLAGTTNFSASEEMYIVKSEAPSHQSVVFNQKRFIVDYLKQFWQAVTLLKYFLAAIQMTEGEFVYLSATH